MMRQLLVIPVVAALAACNPPFPTDETEPEAVTTEVSTADDRTAVAPTSPPPAEVAPPAVVGDVVSRDILAREPVTAFAMVRHVLVSWDALAPIYARQGGQDPRGAARSRAEAAALIAQLQAQLEAGAPIEALMAEYSEDPGTNASARPYEVTEDAHLIQPFIDMALRLQVGEVGVIETDFGFHAMVRLPPDPAVSTAIMDREAVTSMATVRHILISSAENEATYQVRGGQDIRGALRSKEDAREAVRRALTRIEAGEDFAALMAELSEDPGSAATGMTYDVNPQAALVPPFRHLSLRLNPGEVGVVESEFGFHIIERVR